MRFLGMAGYYLWFCRNCFSVITVPLTNVLKKDKEYVWCDSCQAAFTMLKSVLLSCATSTRFHEAICSYDCMPVALVLGQR